MTTKNFIIATAGHVDHGKSSLVQALTGINPDRLPEEKARGITIDLGFAELNLAGPGGDLHAALIDVPGHEDFVRNMIAGVGSIDLALLVVAADDGWMPQTEEHLQILSYLGVDRGAVALTKVDLGNVEKITSQISDKLQDTLFADAPIIPTSVRTGLGLDHLKSVLASELSSMPPQRDIEKARLFIDRAFTLHGIGTVVTGTLTGGTFRRGQPVVVQPQNYKARIRSMQNHGRDSDLAGPGTRTAMNLPDLSVGPSFGSIKRGDVVLSTEELGPSSTVDVLLEKSGRLRQNEPAARPIKNGASIYLHHGTARVAAKVVLLESDGLEPGEKKIAQLRLESPVLAFFGDRFVVRDRSEQHTVGGGLVLDPEADRKNFRSVAQRKLLKARAAALNDVDVCVSSEIERHGPMPMSALLQKSHFTGHEIAAALQRLEGAHHIVVCGEIVAAINVWQTLRNRASALIDQAHAENSERTGLDVNELRAALHHQSEVFEALVSDLSTHGFVRSGSIIARSSHRAALPRHLKEIAERMMTLLEQKSLNPPARKELLLNRGAQQTLAFLIEQGRVIEISADVVLSQSTFAHVKTGVVAYISEHGPATVSQLRQELQTSRRVIVPLLELLDHKGVTQRVGDRRILRVSAESTQ